MDSATQAIIDDQAIVKTNWLDTARRGVAVSLHIGFWRPFVRLEPGDLGLPELTRAQRRTMKLGEKALLPEAWILEVNRAEGKARRTLREYSFDTLGCRFVPVTSYEAWRAENETRRAEFYAVRDRMILDWDQVIRDLEMVYNAAAMELYPQACRLNPALAGPIFGEMSFVRTYLDRVLGQLPSREYVRDSFTYRVDLQFLEPSALIGQVPASGDAALDADLIASMERRRQEAATEFLTDVMATATNLVYEVAVGVLAQADAKGMIPGGTSRSMKKLVEQAPLVNFAGDPEMTKLLEAIRAIADQEAGQRDAAQVARVMRAIGTIARWRLVDLGRAPEDSVRSLGVADLPTLSEVREARQALGIATSDDLALTRSGGRGQEPTSTIEVDAMVRGTR